MAKPNYSQFAAGIPNGPGPDDIIDAEVVDPVEDSKPKPTAEQKPAPEGAKPDTSAEAKPAPDADKSAPKTPVKDVSQITSNDKASTIGKSFGKAYLEAAKSPIKGIPAIVKAEYKAGAALGDKLAGKIAGEGLLKSAGKIGLKTAGRAVPGLGTAIGLYSAYNSFKSGDVVGGALNLVSAIPGPIGWVGLAGAMVWDAVGLGGNKIQMWAEPDGSATHILPGSAKDVGGVTELDQLLRQAQQAVYSFQDGPKGSVWDANPPTALRVDDADVQKAAAAWLGGIADLFAEVDKAMASAGEQYFTEYQARLRPHLDAMAALREQVKPLVAQLASASDGAGEAYKSFLDANRAAREQLSNDSKLSDQAAAQQFTSTVAAAVSKVSAADQNIASIFDTEPAAVLTPTVATGTGTRENPSKKTDPKVTAPAPAVQRPAPQTATPAAQTPARKETPQKRDELSKMLNSLTQQKPVSTPSTPSMPNLGNNGLGGGSPLNSGGGSPLGGQQSKPLSSGEGKKLDDEKKKGDEKRSERKLTDPSKNKEQEEKKPTTPLSASTTDNGETKPATTEQKPGAPAVVPAQPAAAANPAAPAAQGQPQPEQSKEVDIKGQKVTFPDAKTAKLAELLAKADPAHPMPLAEAAKAAGLTPPVPGQDPGSQVAPAQAKPGDLLVSGDKKFMLLGDGKFYDLQEYKVVSADQLPQDAGSRGGYFHLNDPSPTGAPCSQPVSGQTGRRGPGGAGRHAASRCAGRCECTEAG